MNDEWIVTIHIKGGADENPFRLFNRIALFDINALLKSSPFRAVAIDVTPPRGERPVSALHTLRDKK